MRKKVISFYKFVKEVFSEFIGGNVLKYSASLAYYTVLSIAPLIVILLSVVGFFYNRETLSGQLYSEIRKLVGPEAAMQLQESIQHISLSGRSIFATTIGIIVLIIGATGIFGEVQDSLNKIWGLRIKSKKVWWKVLLDRLISFSLIISLGFVLIVSLVLNAIAAALSNRVAMIFPGMGESLLLAVDTIISLLITTFLFGTIFKVLPDAKIKWRDVLTGSLITACLFLLGKYGIGYYLGRSNVGSIYGAAGSIMILMIWVYYSSAILYLGAVFTKIYATNFGGKIQPSNFSVWIKVEEVVADHVQIKEIKPPLPETEVDKTLNTENVSIEKEDPDHR